MGTMVGGVRLALVLVIVTVIALVVIVGTARADETVRNHRASVLINFRQPVEEAA
jgi:hypothetical protein